MQTRASGAPARRVRSTFALGAINREQQLSETSDVELRDLAYVNLDLASHQLDGKSSPTLDAGAELGLESEVVVDDVGNSAVDDSVNNAIGGAVDDAADEDDVEHIANLREPQPVLVGDGLEQPLGHPSAVANQNDESLEEPLEHPSEISDQANEDITVIDANDR